MLCIVVPVFNNPKTLRNVVEGLVDICKDVIVVDDGSDTLASTHLSGINCIIVRHETNKGKGIALISGAKKAKELGFSHFMSVDADGQHFIDDARKIFHSFENKNEIIIGKRDFDSVKVPKASSIGRFLGNALVYIETGVWVSDTQSGLRIYPLSLFVTTFKSSRYEFEIESLVKHLQNDGELKMVDIKTIYPVDRVTHFHKIWDNTRMAILHTKLIVFRIFRI